MRSTKIKWIKPFLKSIRYQFYKGVSEKTPGFNQGMNHVSNGPH